MIHFLVDFLSTLIEIPTVNPPGENYEKLVRSLSSYLRDLGVDREIIEVPEDYLDRHYPYSRLRRGRPRFIVLARLGSGRPIVHFNAHYDVVPAGSGWTYLPFKATVIGDRVYGRDSSDYEGSIACLLAMLKMPAEGKVELKGTVDVAFVPDEEAGGVGTRFLVEKRLTDPDYVIVCEPANLKVVISCKGIVRGLVRVYGKSVHAATPWLGDNVFIKACKFMLRFLEMYEPVLDQRCTSLPVEDPNEAKPVITLGGYANSKPGKDSIVPEVFEFSFDRRVIPEEDIDKVVGELDAYFRKVSEELGVKYELITLLATPPAATGPDSRLVKTCIEILRKLNVKPTVRLSSKRNDMVYYIRYLSRETICIGPRLKEVTYSADEYTEITQAGKRRRSLHKPRKKLSANKQTLTTDAVEYLWYVVTKTSPP